MLRAGFLLSVFFSTAAFVAVIQAILVAVHKPSAGWFPVYYYRFLARLLRIEVREAGTPLGTPVLWIGNHVSWLDIIILGSRRPLRFVAKHEMARWPVFGQLAALSRTIFIERDRRHQAKQHEDAITRALSSDATVMFFPEATTSDGTGILPFKSSIFALAFGEQAITGFQPLSLAYIRLGDEPLVAERMPLVAYYGDMVMLPHLWDYLKVPRGVLEVELRFHEQLTPQHHETRKTLAKRAETIVADSIRQARTDAGCH